MNELIIILKALGIIVLTAIALAILIPLSFYLYKKRTTSNCYRHVEVTILFILLGWWAHGWDNSEEYLTVYWISMIISFIAVHIMLWANPIKKTKKKR